MVGTRQLTPVIAGIGQVANKDPDRIVHPVQLLEDAARLALADAGISPSRIGGVLATPLSVYGDDNASTMLAERLGLAPGLRFVSRYTGAEPQRMIATACRAVRSGDAEAMLVVGGIADASVRRAHDRRMEPPAPPTSHWSQGTSRTPRDLPPRTLAMRGYRYVPEIAAGAGLPSAYFALVESAFAAGRDPATHRAELGRLLSPFTEVAASRPDLAWFPAPRTTEQIHTPSRDNRLVAEPFTKLMCSFPTVDLAAALVIAPDPGGGRVAIRPLGLVSAGQATPPSGWESIGYPASLQRAVDELMRLTGVEPNDIDRFDFYSCFPTAVRLFSTAFGLEAADPRPRTATGGLPYFGGPGASYSIHGVACLVEDLRTRPGALGVAASLGGMVTDFSVGLYGAGDGPCELRELDVAAAGVVPTVATGSGPAVIDAATVLHDQNGPAAAPIIARLPDGSRTGARAADPDLPAALAERPPPIGREVQLRTLDGIVSYTFR